MSIEDEGALIDTPSKRAERRRGSDTVVDMLRDHINSVEEGLKSHVERCAKQQTRVLWAVIATFGWVVTHSPEVLGVIGKMAARVGP